MVQQEHQSVVEFGVDFVADGGEQKVFEISLTSVIYEVGKQHYGKDRLREFFQMVYEVVMGQSSGPRLPVFVMLLGVDEFLSILKEKIK